MTGVETTLGLAVGVGIAAFFSPCAYTLLPGYVGYYVASTERDRPPIGGAALRGIAAAVGVAVAFGVLSVVAVSVGAVLEPVFPVLEAVVGITLVVLGVIAFRGIDVHLTVPLPKRRSSILGFGLFGALYAIAAAGCVAPLFLSVVLQSLTLSPLGAVAVYATVAATFGTLLVAITVLIAIGYGVRPGIGNWIAEHGMRLAGIVLIGAGLGQVVLAIQ